MSVTSYAAYVANRTQTASMIEILAQIKAPHFTAGIVLWDDVVVEAAPIVGYMKKQKWKRERVRTFCAEKHWEVTVVHQLERERP